MMLLLYLIIMGLPSCYRKTNGIDLELGTTLASRLYIMARTLPWLVTQLVFRASVVLQLGLCRSKSPIYD